MRYFIPLALTTALALTACGQPDPLLVGPSTVNQAAANQAPADQAPVNQAQAVLPQIDLPRLHPSQAVVAQLITTAAAPVVKDLGFKNGPSLAVSIGPKEVQRMIQAFQHRWVAADIQNYTVTLTGSSTGVMASSTVTATSGNTSATPGAFAAFTGLPAGQNYTVNVIANGFSIDPATGAVTTTLVAMNTQTPATATFNFMEDANHNINNLAASQNITVQLDSFQFSGSAQSTVNVANGEWIAPGSDLAILPLPLTAQTVAASFNFYGGVGLGMTVDSQDNVYMVQGHLGQARVVRYAPDGTKTADFTLPSATYLSAMAIGPDGKLYVASPNLSSVICSNTDGSDPTTIVSSVNNPTGLAFDSTGNIYVAAHNEQKVYKYSPAGAPLGTAVSGLPQRPLGITFDRNDNLFVTGGDLTDNRHVYKVTPDGTRTTFFTSSHGAAKPEGLAFDALGNLWVTAYDEGKIYRIAPNGTATSYPGGWSGVGAPNEIEVDSTGNLYFTINGPNGTGTLIKVPGAAAL